MGGVLRKKRLEVRGNVMKNGLIIDCFAGGGGASVGLHRERRTT